MKIDGIDTKTKIKDIHMGILLDYPFVYPDMTWGEYWEERENFGLHFRDYHKGTFKSLKQQGKLTHKFDED